VDWAWGNSKLKNFFYEIYYQSGEICSSGVLLLNPSRKCELFKGNCVERCLVLFHRYFNQSENDKTGDNP
jgi:hypothetical protein